MFFILLTIFSVIIINKNDILNIELEEKLNLSNENNNYNFDIAIFKDIYKYYYPKYNLPSDSFLT